MKLRLRANPVPVVIPILLLLWRNGLGVPRSLYFLNPLLLILFMCAGRLLFRHDRIIKSRHVYTLFLHTLCEHLRQLRIV